MECIYQCISNKLFELCITDYKSNNDYIDVLSNSASLLLRSVYKAVVSRDSICIEFY